MKCFLKFAVLGIVGVVLFAFLFHHHGPVMLRQDSGKISNGFEEGQSELKKNLRHSIQRAKGKEKKGNRNNDWQSLKEGYTKELGNERLDGGVRGEVGGKLGNEVWLEREKEELQKGEEEKLDDKEDKNERMGSLHREGEGVIDTEKQKSQEEGAHVEPNVEQLNGEAAYIRELSNRGGVGDLVGREASASGREGDSAPESVSQEQIVRDNAATLKYMKVSFYTLFIIQLQ